jgi:quaternary ammonium compound-resistance protein SugE
MAWVYLLIAAAFEVCWAVGLKYTNGFTRLWPSVLTVTAMAVSLGFLALAVRTIPIGTGYVVWTGIGAVGAAIAGVVLFAEPLTAWRTLFLLLIVGGVVGLKFTATIPHPEPTKDAKTARRGSCESAVRCDSNSSARART